MIKLAVISSSIWRPPVRGCPLEHPLERSIIYLNDYFLRIHHSGPSSPFLWSFSFSPKLLLNISALRRSSIPVSPPYGSAQSGVLPRHTSAHRFFSAPSHRPADLHRHQ